MEPVTFYRGITVAESDLARVIDDIKGAGLSTFLGSHARQGIHFRPLASVNPSMLRSPDLGRALRAPEATPAVYATGDRLTAAWYARENNKAPSRARPLVVEFKANLKDAIVDGNDVLYKAFSAPPRTRGELRIVLDGVYGAAITPYLDEAWRSDDAVRRNECCELALQDRDVVRHHHQNRLHIMAAVRFASAFQVKLPIAPESIVSVDEPGEEAWPQAFPILPLLRP